MIKCLFPKTSEQQIIMANLFCSTIEQQGDSVIYRIQEEKLNIKNKGQRKKKAH